MTDDLKPDDAPRREPVFNAPLMSWLLPLLLIGLYASQSSLSPYVQSELIEGFGLKPVLLRQGHIDLLLTHLFLHGSWLHVLANSTFCLAFSAPVIRLCGRGVSGAASFLSFYLLCGAIAGLGDSLLNWTSAIPILGASGAISGLMGAAMRIRTWPDGAFFFAPFNDSRIIGMTVFWIGVNVISAFVPMLVGAAEGQGIAWQAHVVGYLFGLVMIEPWVRLTRQRLFNKI